MSAAQVVGRVYLLDPDGSKNVARALLRAQAVVRCSDRLDMTLCDDEPNQEAADLAVRELRASVEALAAALRVVGDPREFVTWTN